MKRKSRCASNALFLAKFSPLTSVGRSNLKNLVLRCYFIILFISSSCESSAPQNLPYKGTSDTNTFRNRIRNRLVTTVRQQQ